MIAATALVTANDATPAVAEAAVQQALARGGCQRAAQVLLFLTPDFTRNATACVTAASRAAQCLQVFGGIAASVANEHCCSMDRPAAVALILDELPAGPSHTTRLSWCNRLRLPDNWKDDPPRIGQFYSDALSQTPPPVWQNARVQESHQASLTLPGLAVEYAISTGTRIQGGYHRVSATIGHDLEKVREAQREISAVQSLNAALPPELRDKHPLPLQIVSVATRRTNQKPTDSIVGPPHLIPLLSTNANGSITLAEPLSPGDKIAWALRLPDLAETDMRASLDLLERRNHKRTPLFGTLFSCIGRGPFFYAGEDRDWLAFRQRFPDLPFIATYGSGQLFPSADGNRLLQYSVVSALFSPNEEPQ